MATGQDVSKSCSAMQILVCSILDGLIGAGE